MKKNKPEKIKMNVNDISIYICKSGKNRKLTKLEKIKTLSYMCKKTRNK